ncbi:MAG TPA: hypothetical protein VHN79_11265 [Lacunisphaera sp.]|nr:hypothetical protein [Lacunisphaera sp.]
MKSSRAPLPWNAAVWLALAAAAGGAVACLWWAWCHFPQLAWNDARLAPAFALRHGINPYPPEGGGPLSTWIYGPVGLLLNLPATFAATAARALHAASLLNFGVVLAPLLVVFFGSAELRARGLPLCSLAFALGVLLVPAPNLVLQVADHAAIAFGLLSCWTLARPAAPRARDLGLAALLCALAIGSKQIAVFAAAGQGIFLLLAHGRRTALAYAGGLAACVLLGGTIMIAAFGRDALWLNLVAIPAKLPWADIPARLAMRPLALLAQVVLPLLGLLLLWRTGRWPHRGSVSGRFFQLTALVFGAMLPIGLAGYGKIGGDTNLLHSANYLMPAALLAWLVGGHQVVATARSLLVVTACALVLHWPRLTSLPVRPHTQHLAMAAQITAAFPQAVWFPQNPVITFYADGRLWHSEDGIVTRHLAGRGLRGPEFRPHLPPRLKAVAYPVFNKTHATMSLLPEFSRTTELPYWTLLTAPDPVTPRRE